MRFLPTITLALCAVSSSASEPRPLTDAEESSLRLFATKTAGIGIWYVQASVATIDGHEKAHSMVVFQPTNATETCLAPAILFVGNLSKQESAMWRTPDNAQAEYKYWNQPCDLVNPDSAITLKRLVDLGVLERLKKEQDSIVSNAIKNLSPVRDYSIAASAHQLSRVNIRFDADYGIVYELRYSANRCRGLSVHTVLESDETKIVGTWVWLY